MKYRLRDLPALLMTPPGRWEICRAAVYRAWPVLRLVATAYRRTVIRHTRLVVVVGSLGKTSTVRAVVASLDGVGPRFASNQFGFLALSVLAIAPWRRRAVVEVGLSGPGQMATYARMLRPDVVVVTSIASEHGSSFGTLDSTRDEKADMIRALPKSGTAVLNADDQRVLWMADQTGAKVVTYGLKEGAEVAGSRVRLRWPIGTSVTVSVAGQEIELQSRLLGPHMVLPLLASAAVAVGEGIGLADAVRRLEELEPGPGRMQPLRLPSGVVVIRDDQKSPIESIERALATLVEIPARRRVAVLGDVTEPPGRQGPIYAALGRRVAEVADRAFFVGRCGSKYQSGTRRGGMPREVVTLCGSDPAKALELIRRELRDGDVVLIKGRCVQRLERLTLALQGKEVRCFVKDCDATNLSCDRCSMLGRGWEGRRAVERRPRPSTQPKARATYWQDVGEQWLATLPQQAWRRHNDRVVADCLADWGDGRRRLRALKTDLFEEAMADGLIHLLTGSAERVIGVDMSMPVLRAAGRKHTSLVTARCDARAMPFPDGSFGLVVSTSTLDHFATQTALRRSLAGIARLLEPDGVLLLTLDNLANPVVALRNALPWDLLRRLGLSPYYVGATCGPRRLRRYLEEAGLEVVEMTAILHCPRALAVRLAARADRRSEAVTSRLISRLARFERLRRLPTRYLTGYFLAVKAVQSPSRHAPS